MIDQSGGTEYGSRLEVLDLLRFTAAVSVVIYHFSFYPTFLKHNEFALLYFTQPIAKYGYLGVELFFLISGFVISWSASGRSPTNFIVSRAARLLPSLWVAILATSVVLILSNKGDIVKPIVIFANMTTVAGLLGQPYIDGVYWTLQIEVKFYVLIFLLSIFGQVTNFERWLFAWLFSLAVCSTEFGPKWLGSITLYPYGSFFLAGSMFYIIWRDGISFLRIGVIIVDLGLCLLCVTQEAPGFMRGDQSMEALGIAGSIVCFQFAILTLVALRRINLPRSRWWFTIGSLTYPLYLVHNVIGKAIAASASEHVTAPAALFIGIGVALGLSAVLSFTVERRACPWVRRLLLRGVHKLGPANEAVALARETVDSRPSSRKSTCRES